MSITLDELLLLVGRLDDAPGFDTPRERFRRFLIERVTDVPTASALIDDCQRSVGEQRHRALQDLDRHRRPLAALRGRRSAPTSASADAVKVDGQWRSPGLLDVVLEIRTEQTTSATLDGLARATAAAPGAGLEPRIGLCVVARQYAARGRLSRALDVSRLPDIRVVSVASLLALAAQAAADRLVHAEVVKLLHSGVALDFVIDLLDRPAATASPSNRRRNRVRRRRQRRTSRHSGSRPSPGMKWPPRSSCWHRSSPSGACSRSVRGGNCAAKARRATGSGSLFPARGSSDTRNWNRSSMTVRRWFATPGASVVSTGWSTSRSTNAPILQALRADRPFAVPPADVPLIGPCLAPIARQDFLALMTFRDGAENFERSATA